MNSCEFTAKESHCECGRVLGHEDAEFWGECRTCRHRLPIQTAQTGDTRRSSGETDRQFHGGRGPSAEW